MRISWMIVAAGLLMPVAAQASEADVVKRLTERAEAGDTAAQLDLAFHYWRDRFDAEDLSLRWFRAAAEAGDSEAVYELGLIQRDGLFSDTPRDWAAGMALIEKAAELGHGAARYDVTTCCDMKEDPGPYDHHLSYAMPEDGVERLRWDYAWLADVNPGDETWDACYNEINRLEKAGYGDGIAFLRSTFIFSLDSAQDGEPGSAREVADAYLRGTGVKPDLTAAEMWYRIDADTGNLDTQIMLAHRYFDGDFGAPNPAMALAYAHRAVDMLRPSANAGDPDAQFMLAQFYESQWLEADDSQGQAFALYRSAAVAGHAEAQSVVSEMYFEGKAVSQSNARGLYWLTRAANNMEHPEINGPAGYSNSLAQFALGKIYLEGKLTPRDWYQADYWYELGMSHHVRTIYEESRVIEEEYVAATREAEKHLTKVQLMAIKKAVDDWNARAKRFNDDRGWQEKAAGGFRRPFP